MTPQLPSNKRFGLLFFGVFFTPRILEFFIHTRWWKTIVVFGLLFFYFFLCIFFFINIVVFFERILKFFILLTIFYVIKKISVKPFFIIEHTLIHNILFLFNNFKRRFSLVFFFLSIFHPFTFKFVFVEISIFMSFIGCFFLFLEFDLFPLFLTFIHFF